ncbi:MAG TPA: glycine zipper 2TM domain-containing protein, partial [Longimicrobiales bacterium]|nr:glycine zipper 2TM domain-containing protein [Longimicrobiales bacterium]
VTRVDHSNRVGETAVLNVAFESISFGGRSYGLDASVIEANPERKTRQSTGTQAGKIAAGAAAGAIIGRVLGKDTKSTLKGAAVGAAAGTAIAMGTADVDVVLAAGSAMRVRLDGPITVRRPIS